MWPWFTVYVTDVYSLDRIIKHFDLFALMFCDATREWLQMCCEYYFWKLDLALKLALEHGNISSFENLSSFANPSSPANLSSFETRSSVTTRSVQVSLDLVSRLEALEALERH